MDGAALAANLAITRGEVWMKKVASARGRGSRAVPIAMILFALVAVLFGVIDPTTRPITYDNRLTLLQQRTDRANVTAGFAKRMPPKDRADPLGSP
jgi:hypothetical protein